MMTALDTHASQGVARPEVPCIGVGVVRDNAGVSTRLLEPDYQLVWPRVLFRAQASKLLNRRELRDWDDRCELLLDDAFVRGLST